MTPTVLIVPGLRDHVADHWQTLLQHDLEQAGMPVACVPRRSEDKLSCAGWVDAIERSVAAIDGPIVLCAHSGGVLMVAHWARRQPASSIGGALLATPADLESPLPAGYPATDTLRAHGWLPMPREPLPFPTIVAASSNDPLASAARVAELANDWGAKLVAVGPVGHLNPAAGFGPWPRARPLLDDVIALARGRS
jgi:predicted alpha/beta hydrolase family esterase